MSDDQVPDVDEIKERLQVDIPVEEDDVMDKASAAVDSVSDELRTLGRQLAETLRTAWDSEERVKLQGEVRDGVQVFVAEVEKVFSSVRESAAARRASDAAEAVETAVEDVAADIEMPDAATPKAKLEDAAHKGKGSIVDGLRWLSEELSTLADKFTPMMESAAEKAGDAVADAAETVADAADDAADEIADA